MFTGGTIWILTHGHMESDLGSVDGESPPVEVNFVKPPDGPVARWIPPIFCFQLFPWEEFPLQPTQTRMPVSFNSPKQGPVVPFYPLFGGRVPLLN